MQILPRVCKPPFFSPLSRNCVMRTAGVCVRSLTFTAYPFSQLTITVHTRASPPPSHLFRHHHHHHYHYSTPTSRRPPIFLLTTTGAPPPPQAKRSTFTATPTLIPIPAPPPSFDNNNNKNKKTKTKTNMRLPYVPNPPIPKSEEESAIVDRITARRHPRPLQPLDLTLLHSPAVADGWNSFLGAVRTRTVVPADLRELAISRVAVVNGAWYEWMHHAPLAVAAGVGEEGMAVARRDGELLLLSPSSSPEGGMMEIPQGLSEKQWVVLCYADEMTRNVEVRDGTFERLRALFDEKEVVEITATVRLPRSFYLPLLGDVCNANRKFQIACYNCVSRFLVALDGKYARATCETYKS